MRCPEVSIHLLTRFAKAIPQEFPKHLPPPMVFGVLVVVMPPHPLKLAEVVGRDIVDEHDIEHEAIRPIRF